MFKDGFFFISARIGSTLYRFSDSMKTKELTLDRETEENRRKRGEKEKVGQGNEKKEKIGNNKEVKRIEMEDFIVIAMIISSRELGLEKAKG